MTFWRPVVGSGRLAGALAVADVRVATTGAASL
jgi:hypothetical protein